VKEPPAGLLCHFRYLYGRFREKLPYWMHRFGVPGADIPDAVQEALLHCFEHAEVIRNDPDGELKAMLRLARKVATSLRRRQARAAVREAGYRVLATPSNDGSPLDAVLDMCERIYALRDPWRAAVVLVDVQGLSYAEAAKELNTTAKAIENWVLRGRAEIRRNDREDLGAALLLLAEEPDIRAGFSAYCEAKGVLPVGSVPGWPLSLAPSGPLLVLAACFGCLALGVGLGALIGPPAPIPIQAFAVAGAAARYVPGRQAAFPRNCAAETAALARPLSPARPSPPTHERLRRGSAGNHALAGLPEPREKTAGETFADRASGADP